MESSLEKLLRLADVSQLEPAGWDEDEVHEHLSGECPWYKAVAGGDNPTDFSHCEPAKGKGGPPRLVVKLTPRTAEASTVDQPTVPPGGPGLFHIKGRHLPPYIQHLYKHLVGRYGKQGAYRVAVGVVKKWKSGVNPGGKHPGHVHGDVQAAAGKNIAAWEKDKADAHAQSRAHDRGHVRATAAEGVEETPQPGEDAFPGQQQIDLPPVPGNKIAVAMFTAHRIDDALRDLAHANERFIAAKKSRATRVYNMMHANNHLSHALDNCHALVDSVRRNYQPEALELDAVTKTMGLTKSVSADAKAATFAHLLQTVIYHQTHAKRHALCMLHLDPEAEWKFNYDHATTHSKAAMEHTFKLAKHVFDNYPAEAVWFKKLEKAEDPADPYVGLARATAPGAQSVFISPAPGAPMAQYGLHQKPSQTVSPSPPLPPDVAAPTPREVRALISLVPECSDVSLSNGIRKFLETAAVKLEKNDEVEALASLRSAQSSVFSAAKTDQARAMPWTYNASVFTRVPGAEQSSATTAMLQARDQALAYRKLMTLVAADIDRLRKRFFRGRVNGPLANMRLSRRG